MPLRSAEITKHAWERFTTRWEGERPPCFRRILLSIMAEAQEEDIGYHGVARLLNSHMIPARYFITQNWRFVTNEDITTILTIERPEYRGRLKNVPRRMRRNK